MPTHTLTHLTGTTDHRASLQALIDGAASGDIVVIPANATPYTFTNPGGAGDPAYAITLKSNITLTINGDLVANTGGFTGTRDSFIGCDKLTGVTINGTGSISGAAMPQTGEHRHILSMRGASNITISGGGVLRFNSSGGDGLYLGPTEADLDEDRTTNIGISVTGLIMSGNRRNACSVLTARGLTFTECQFLNSTATSPRGGLVFEPEDDDRDELTNVLVESCVASGNASRDYMLQCDSMSYGHPDIDVTFRNCRSVRTSQSPWGFNIRHQLIGTSNSGCYPTGTVRLDNCSAEGLNSAGLQLEVRGNSALRVILNGFTVNDCARDSVTTYPIAIDTRQVDSVGPTVYSNPAASGLGTLFQDCVVIDPRFSRIPAKIIEGTTSATNRTGNIKCEVNRWPRVATDALLPNVRIGRFGKLPFSNSAKARRSASRRVR